MGGLKPFQEVCDVKTIFTVTLRCYLPSAIFIYLFLWCWHFHQRGESNVDKTAGTFVQIQAVGPTALVVGVFFTVMYSP